MLLKIPTKSSPLRLVVWLSICFSPLVYSNNIHYTVTTNKGLSQFHITACFGNSQISSLAPALTSALRYISYSTNQTTIQNNRGKLIFASPLQNQCFKYQLNLAKAARITTQSNFHRVGSDLIISPRIWMLYPPSIKPETIIRVSFRLPPEYNVITPWKPIVNSNTVFEFQNTPMQWPSLVAIGKFEIKKVHVKNSVLRVALIDQRKFKQRRQMYQWIRSAAQATASLYGEFPVKSPQILVIPIGRKKSAVPFAQVMRGGGLGAHFYVDENRNIREFMRDWNATHELSHMFHPYISKKDVWFSEGLATYLQSILMARGGLIDEQQAWQLMHNGFRLARESPHNQSLTEAAINIHRDKHYLRIYWTGAAIALIADFKLRKHSGGKLTLGSVLKQFKDCCMGDNRQWTAKQMMLKLDQLAGLSIFIPLYQKYSHSKQFPNLKKIYRQLGIKVKRNYITFSAARGKSKLRRQITGNKTKVIIPDNPDWHENGRDEF